MNSYALPTFAVLALLLAGLVTLVAQDEKPPQPTPTSLVNNDKVSASPIILPPTKGVHYEYWPDARMQLFVTQHRSEIIFIDANVMRWKEYVAERQTDGNWVCWRPRP